jgi:hypothetical protein
MGGGGGGGGGGGVWKSVNSKNVGIFTVNLWKVFWNDKQYFFLTLHGKFLVLSRLTVTEIEWITTHDIPPSEQRLFVGKFETSFLLIFLTQCDSYPLYIRMRTSFTPFYVHITEHLNSFHYFRLGIDIIDNLHRTSNDHRYMFANALTFVPCCSREVLRDMAL